MHKVSVHIVTYNSLQFLDTLLISLAHQTFQDFSVLIVDNASSDGTVAHVRAHWPAIGIIQNRNNAGFARAHNQAIQFTKSEYVVVLNADIILHERFINELVRIMDVDQTIGSASGKILRAVGDPREIGKETLSTIIDSTGIIVDRKRFYRDRGAGEEDQGQYNEINKINLAGHHGLWPSEIIGPSGAAALYRREALESVCQNGEYFDTLFDSYKEDIDLAIRLLCCGWTSRFVPSARAYHYRRIGGNARGIAGMARAHAMRSSHFALLSYRNHWYTLIKNESWYTVWRDLPWIIIWEIGKMIFMMGTKPWVVYIAWRDVAKHWRRLREKRRCTDFSRPFLVTGKHIFNHKEHRRNKN